MPNQDTKGFYFDKINTGKPGASCPTCGTAFSAAYASKLKLNPFKDYPCQNSKCKTKLHGVPPDLIVAAQ